ncbi:MAG: hypothetical protein KGI37_02505 [Alphaproteobacteria bacterium]|nr:hypothetical protein [Alphaproteobacteria bacterium]
MTIMRFIAAFAVVLCLITAASPARAGDGEVLGTGIGAAMGGLLGSQLGRGGGWGTATGLGIVGGAVAGNMIGQSIDNANRDSYAASGTDFYDPAVEPAFTTPYAPNYVAPPAPPPIYTDQSTGAYCREFSQQIIIDGRPQESYGTACLQPDGTWRIMP